MLNFLLIAADGQSLRKFPDMEDRMSSSDHINTKIAKVDGLRPRK